MITIRPKTREEWLNLRKKGIGSSEIGTLLGVNPFETRYQLWRRKTGLDAPKDENFVMKAGHYLEDAVSKFYSDETQREIIRSSAPDFLVIDPKRDFITASPDRLYWIKGMKHASENKGIVECKTTQMKIDPDNLPKHWFCQLQWQLGISGFKEGSLAWLTQGRDFGYRDFAINADFFEWEVAQAEKFWKENVLGGKEPEIESDEDVALKYPTSSEGKAVEADSETVQAWMDLKAVKSSISELEEQKALLEGKLKVCFNDAESLIHNGDVLATWKSAKPSEKFDVERFKVERPNDYALYVKEVAGPRRFLVK